MLLKPIKAIAKKLDSELDKYKTFAFHKTRATNAKKVITQSKNKNSKLARVCREYAIDVLKHPIFFYDIYAYSLFNEGFQEGFIPQSYYDSVVVPTMSGKYANIANLRIFEHYLLDQNSLPTIGYYHQGGGFFSASNNYLKNSEVKDFLFDNRDKIVFKLDTSSQGKGVYVFDKDNFSVNKVKSLGTGNFQYFIEQHQSMNKLNNNSVATLRITTVNDNGSIKAYSSHLRASYGKSQSMGADRSYVRIGIDINTGKALKALTLNYETIDKHPNTSIFYKDLEIPNFSQAVNKVTELHRHLPFIHCIGWDVAIGKNQKIYVMEFNAKGNGVFNHQLFSGSVFKKLNWERLATPKLKKPLWMLP